MLNQAVNRRGRPRIYALALLACLLALPSVALGQDDRRARGDGEGFGGGEFAARRLFMTAENLLEAGQDDRAVKALERVLDQYGDLDVRYEALLALGKHYIGERDQRKAVHYLNQVLPLGEREPAPTGDLLEVYLESLYQIGVANFQMQQYAAAFPVLRKITEEYPNTVWANQAYYYIGMCHFARQRWRQAIDALSLVGTFVDPDSESVQYVEAGRRFYVKIEDMDLPVQYNLGNKMRVRVESSSGDSVTLPLQPLALDEGIFIASAPTEVGQPVDESAMADPKSPVLQVVSGDELTVFYVDGNTPEGERDVPREATVRVVSSARLRFTLGTFEDPASVAYLAQPLFVKLDDADMDGGPRRDAATVRLVSRFKAEEEAADGETFNVETDIRSPDEDPWRMRDSVDLIVEELGENPVRTGEFGGQVQIDIAGEEPDRTDDRLAAKRGDQIVASFVDERHIDGTSPREVTASIAVVGEIDATPNASQNVVTDPVLRAKKNIVEATAFLELARIFKSMGLLDGAADKADEGLDRVNQIITMEEQIPDEERQQAFKLRWELFLVQDRYNDAIATCTLFNRLYPESPFVDQALLGIAEVKMEQEDFVGARAIYGQILRLPNSQVKPRAQFELARTYQLEEEQKEENLAAEEEREPEDVISERAIQEFRICAQKYPDSEYAGKALGWVIDYYRENRDFIRADDLLSQVFQDYPDAEFLDEMLLKWTIVAFQMGNYQKAHEKCSDLLFQYPESDYADTAKNLLPRIKERMN